MTRSEVESLSYPTESHGPTGIAGSAYHAAAQGTSIDLLTLSEQLSFTRMLSLPVKVTVL